MLNPSIERLPDVLRRVGWSRSTLYSRIEQGRFPKPIPLGSSHAVGWLSAEVTAAIEEMVRASRPDTASAAGE
jgi:prophage regulatory protein